MHCNSAALHASGSLQLTTFYHMHSVTHPRYIEKMSSSLIYRFKTCPSSNSAEWGSLSIAHTAVIKTDSCRFFVLLWKDSSVLWNRQQVHFFKWLASFTNTASSKAEFVASSKRTLWSERGTIFSLPYCLFLQCTVFSNKFCYTTVAKCNRFAWKSFS